jgi:hypothetical protein
VAGEAILRLGRNQVLAGILVILSALRTGYITGSAAYDPGRLLDFFLLVTFVGFVIDLASSVMSELLFRLVSRFHYPKKQKLLDEKRQQLISIVTLDPALSSFVVENPRHVWKLAARFLSQTQEMGFSPMEDFDRCASFTLVGLTSLALGITSFVMDASNRVDVGWSLVLMLLGFLLLVAGQAEAVNFIEGTLAGMRERIRTLREEQAKQTGLSSTSPAQINRVMTQLEDIASRFGKNEGVRTLDSSDIRNLFQDRTNVNLLDVEAVRTAGLRILDRVTEDSSQSVQLNLMYTLSSILNVVESVDAYTILEQHFAPKYAGLVLAHLIKQNITPFENGLVNVVVLFEAPEVAKAMLTVLGDLEPGTPVFQVVSNSLANSHLGDSNRVTVRDGFRDWAEKKPQAAGSLEDALRIISQRENSVPGQLSNAPVLVRLGRIPPTGLRNEGASKERS